MSDHDLACITLKSPLDWAEHGQMPDTRAHFSKVSYDLLEPAPLPRQQAEESRSLQPLDMARCASEVRLDLR